jgi:hypothetical protein
VASLAGRVAGTDDAGFLFGLFDQREGSGPIA